MIVLDTSVLSLAFRRRRGGKEEPSEVSHLRELVDQDYPLAVPGIVYQELLSGVRDRRQFTKLERALGAFPIVPATIEHHVLAARVANDCRRKGVAAATADCLIAATAIAASGQLFTRDPDFERIAACTSLRLYALRE